MANHPRPDGRYARGPRLQLPIRHGETLSRLLLMTTSRPWQAALHRIRWAVPCLALAFAVSAHAGTSDLKAGVFDPPRTAPEFTLTGSDGRELRPSQYRGKVVLLSFGFTSCGNVCPVTLGVLASARRQLGPRGADVQVIYVTVDPQRDDAAQMKRYLAGFDPTFIGGTGSEAQLAAVRQLYGIQAEKKVYGDSYTWVHSSFVYLIDRQGALRALMPFGHSPEDYVHDLNVLLTE